MASIRASTIGAAHAQRKRTTSSVNTGLLVGLWADQKPLMLLGELPVCATTFYFAIGRDYRHRDLAIALACGQRHFLVPAGSLAARRLRAISGIHVALDSAAYPPNNPKRISRAAYWQEVVSWRRRCGDWGGLDWFASYNTIGNIAQTRHDEQELQALIRRDAPDAPILRVVGFGTPVAEAAAVILAHPLDGASRPSYGLGGLAIQRYNATADAWYQELLDMLEGADEAALRGVALHLFGIGKPSWILRSKRALIVSFDSSGPGRMAGIAGWRGIAAHYTPIYGVSAEKLQCSREARLSFHLCRYPRSVGLPWTHVDQSLFLDDHREPAGIQHTLILDDAILARDGYGGMSAESLPNTTRHASAFRAEDSHTDYKHISRKGYIRENDMPRSEALSKS